MGATKAVGIKVSDISWSGADTNGSSLPSSTGLLGYGFGREARPYTMRQLPNAP
jgi:hypothetical protein